MCLCIFAVDKCIFARPAQKIAKELRQGIEEFKGRFPFLRCFANAPWLQHSLYFFSKTMTCAYYRILLSIAYHCSPSTLPGSAVIPKQLNPGVSPRPTLERDVRANGWFCSQACAVRQWLQESHPADDVGSRDQWIYPGLWGVVHCCCQTTWLVESNEKHEGRVVVRLCQGFTATEQNQSLISVHLLFVHRPSCWTQVDWEPLEFLTAERNGVPLLRGIDEIQTVLDDHISKTQAIRSSHSLSSSMPQAWHFWETWNDKEHLRNKFPGLYRFIAYKTVSRFIVNDIAVIWWFDGRSQVHSASPLRRRCMHGRRRWCTSRTSSTKWSLCKGRWNTNWIQINIHWGR